MDVSDKTIENWAMIVMAGLILIMFGIGTEQDMQQAEADQANYCEMVALYERSGGANGWPDFRRNAKEVCQ